MEYHQTLILTAKLYPCVNDHRLLLNLKETTYKHERLAEEGTDGMLDFGRHLSQQLVGVERGHADKCLGGLDDLLSSPALQSLGLQCQSDEVKAAGCLLNNRRVLSGVNVSHMGIVKMARGIYLLVNQLREESVGVGSGLLIVDYGQCSYPSLNDLLDVVDLCTVKVKNFCDTSAGVLGCKDVVTRPCIRSLTCLEEQRQTCVSEFRPRCTTFVCRDTGSVCCGLSVGRDIILHAIDQWLDDVTLECPRLRTTKLQNIIQNTQRPLSLC